MGAPVLGGVVADTYVFDGTVWRKLNTITKPSGRISAAMRRIPSKNEHVMVGGKTAASDSNLANTPVNSEDNGSNQSGELAYTAIEKDHTFRIEGKIVHVAMRAADLGLGMWTEALIFVSGPNFDNDLPFVFYLNNKIGATLLGVVGDGDEPRYFELAPKMDGGNIFQEFTHICIKGRNFAGNTQQGYSHYGCHKQIFRWLSDFAFIRTIRRDS